MIRLALLFIALGYAASCPCPRIYRPVCARDASGSRTYANRCIAECKASDGAEISEGKCQCGCSKILKPVCAGGRDFLNECMARCESYFYSRPGKCNEGSCIQVVQPVCGSNRGDAVTYSNRCELIRAGVKFEHDGACPSIDVKKREIDSDCICPMVYNPVCGKDNETYGNVCQANCAQTELKHVGTCEEGCGCIDVYDPVCGSNGKTYSNKCQAYCAGVESDEGSCPSIDVKKREEDSGCFCTEQYDPVCGKDGKTYPNECKAYCGGTKKARAGRCEDECFCTSLYQPVCGEDDKTYSNSCEARCAGVSVKGQGTC